MTFKNREGFCFSAHYKGLSAGMTMQVWRLEPHLLEMLLPWVKKIGVTQFMSGMQCYPCHQLDELSNDRPVSGCAVGSRPPVSQ